MPFLDLIKPLPPTYLPTYQLILKYVNDFNLGTKLTQSNGPLSTNQIANQIVNHFVNHSGSQNDKVQFAYLYC
jgi:hypothetical protein